LHLIDGAVVTTLSLFGSDHILLLDFSKTVLLDTFVTNLFSESIFVDVGKVEANANQITLRAVIISFVIIIFDDSFSLIVISSEVLESLDVSWVSENVICVNALQVHALVLHPSVCNILNGFLVHGLDTVAVSHVQLFLDSPFLVIIIEAVGIGINVLIDVDFVKHQVLAAFTHKI
jgi:hypothetical protein